MQRGKQVSPIRTRFAPSPTGEVHIGSVWMVLMQWLHAKHTGGAFIVRIEDTDRQRFVPGAEEQLWRILAWLGITPDEGPTVGGSFGPYRQSERLPLYQEHAKTLLRSGAAYYCFCTAERLQELRLLQQHHKQPTGYDGHCRALDAAAAVARAQYEPHVIRLAFPKAGQTIFSDIIRGEVSFTNELIDDQVLIKSDGWPTYHLASVVDDHFMEIEPVIRGEEWLPSTPKHLWLYQSFGWKPPHYAHLPLILGTDKAKLSKRHGAISAETFRTEGYLPEALINFLALLGWHPKGDKEVFPVAELQREFQLEDVHKAPAIFDRDKLLWLNTKHLQALPTHELLQKIMPHLSAAGMLLDVSGHAYQLPDGRLITSEALQRMATVIQDRIRILSDAPSLMSIFLRGPENYKATLLAWKESSLEETFISLQAVGALLANLSDKTFAREDTLEQALQEWIAIEKRGVGDTLWPLRVALSGQRKSPGPFAMLWALGNEESQRRIQGALQKLGEPGINVV